MQIKSVGQGRYRMLVAAMSVGRLQFDDGILSDADTVLIQFGRGVREAAGGEFHDGDVERQFRRCCGLRQAYLAAELVLEVDERPLAAAERCQDLNPASLIIEGDHRPNQDGIESRYAVQPPHHVGQQAII